MQLVTLFVSVLAILFATYQWKRSQVQDYLKRHKSEDLQPLYEKWRTELRLLATAMDYSTRNGTELHLLEDFKIHLKSESNQLPHSMAWEHAKDLKEWNKDRLTEMITDAQVYLKVEMSFARDLMRLADKYPTIAQNPLRNEALRLANRFLTDALIAPENPTYSAWFEVGPSPTKGDGQIEVRTHLGEFLLMKGKREQIKPLREELELIIDGNVQQLTELGGQGPRDANGKMPLLRDTILKWRRIVNEMGQEIQNLYYFAIGNDECKVCCSQRHGWLRRKLHKA